VELERQSLALETQFQVQEVLGLVLEPELELVEPQELELVEPPELELVEPPELELVQPPELELVEPLVDPSDLVDSVAALDSKN
jgi:hypothetical protein